MPGDPNADADPPGIAPPGDSRSFRRFNDDGVEEFLLIYRDSTFLIIRAGVVGKEGTWTVKSMPSQGAAAHHYAVECSDFTSQGYYDLR